MKIKKGFVLREVCGEKVIVGEGLRAVNFGRLLAMNDTAAWLWQQTHEMDNFDAESLASKLCDEYDVSMDQAMKDAADLLSEWQSVGVVES